MKSQRTRASEAGAIAPDPYGIPKGIFGPLDPELPALIGRIAMLSAVVETKVDSLASSLSRQLQSQTAGTRPADNLQTCRAALRELARDPGRELLAVATGALLDEVEVALVARNTVVHRVWPRPGVADGEAGSQRRRDNEIRARSSGLIGRTTRAMTWSST